MLQMSCPNCNGVINSQFLAEVSTFECGQCNQDIAVKDIFITTKYFTISREDFLNRIFHFQRLLRDVEEERILLANNDEASNKSIESLEMFYASLQELLVGARDSYRMEVPGDILVGLNDLGKKSKGKLLNLSVEGGSIELVEFNKVPRRKSELKIDFSFPELSERLYTHAKVVWIKEHSDDSGSQCIVIGVTFTELDENTRMCIWHYILDNALVPFQQVAS